jgi:hypothetical protein
MLSLFIGLAIAAPTHVVAQAATPTPEDDPP